MELTAGRMPDLQATPESNTSGGLASVGDLAKSKTKKGKAEHAVHLAALLITIFDHESKAQRTEPSEPRSPSWQDSKKRTIWYNGGHRKTRANRVRPECSKLISRTRRVVVKQYGCKRQTREKNKEKKVKMSYCSCGSRLSEGSTPLNLQRQGVS